MRRFKRELELRFPHAPVGRAAIPSAGALIPLMLQHGVIQPRDVACWPRFLLLLNTDMRCCETAWRNLLLSDVRVFFTADGNVDCIVFEIRFSKTRKTRADALIKIIFPRLDALDAAGPFLLYLKVVHGIVPVPTVLAYGCKPPALSVAPLPVFACAAPGAADKHQHATGVMRSRIRSWGRAAGLVPAVLKQLGAHSCHVTFANALAAAGALPDFIERVVGWGASSSSMADHYARYEGAVALWRHANSLLAAFLLR